MPIPKTDRVRNDEPCFHLSEVNLQAPGSSGWHRYEILYVVRNDALAEYRRDLGPREQFGNAQQVRVLGGIQEDTFPYRIEILHTVAELREFAHILRAGLMPPPEIEPRDLWADWHKQGDERRRRRRKSSTFGRCVKIQRD